MRLPAAARPISEERVKDIAKAAENIEPIERLASAAVGAHAGFPELVVLRPLVRIREDLVRLVDFLEYLFRVATFVAVGVELHGLLAESLADFLFSDAFTHAEDVVIIPISHS